MFEVHIIEVILTSSKFTKISAIECLENVLTFLKPNCFKICVSWDNVSSSTCWSTMIATNALCTCGRANADAIVSYYECIITV